MFAEGETELRDLIVQNLETSGVLNKIKAELRAGVFLALEEEGNLRKKIPIFNQKFDDFISTNDGKLALSIVHEFLEYFNLNFTLSVFNPEVACSSPYIERTELHKQLNVNESEGPVLSALLKRKRDAEVQHSDSTFKRHLDSISENFSVNEKSTSDDTAKKIVSSSISETSKSSNENLEIRNTEKAFADNIIENKMLANIKSIDEKQPSSEVSSGSDNIQTVNKSTASDLFKEKNQTSSSNLDSFFDEPVSNILKEKTSTSNIDSFFDDPVPSEKPSFLNLYDGFLGQTKPGSSLSSDKNDLVSLRNLPSLTSTTNKETLPKLTPVGSGKDNYKKDLDVESSEELSDRQMNSEDSIEEDIEEDFSAGLDDLLNSSLSLADDATSDQTVSQTSVVEGVDHIENL